MPRKKAPNTERLQKEIEAVLSASGESLQYKAIAEEIGKRRTFKDFGPDPAKEVYYAMYNDIALHPESTHFEKTGRGMFALKDRPSPKVSSVAPESATPEMPDDSPERAAGIVRAFGMYWRREWVRWQNNPKLLGQQQQGAKEVNFHDQRGVYLLLDGREVVYVGRAGDQALGQRLFQHNFDRLNGRWDRFSWFGISAVGSDAGLIQPDISHITVEDVITMMEALLIEGLEPRQNRKRGDDFQAVEYLQLEDPAIQRERDRRTLDAMRKKLNID